MSQDHNPYAAPLAELVDVTDPNSDAEAIRREHIKHESAVRSVSLLYFIAGGLMALAALLEFAGVLFAPPGGGSAVGPFELAIAALIAVGFAPSCIVLGIGLRCLSQWVRTPVGLISAVGLLAFPPGTLINSYILYIVFCKKGKVIFSDDYREVIRQTPYIKYQTSRLLIILFILAPLLLLIGFGLLIVAVG